MGAVMFAYLMSVWHGFGPETKAAFIQGVATIIAAAAGAAVVMRQIKAQAQSNQANIAENERRRLKAKMYDDVVRICDEFSEAQGAFVGALMLASQEIQIAALTHSEGQPSPIPRSRIMVLNEQCSSYQTAVIRMLSLIGQSKFIDPRMDIFGTAFSCESEAVRDAFSREFFPFVMRLLPVDRPGGQEIFPYQPPTIFQAEQTSMLADRIRDHVSNSVGYAVDFSVEMQNLLLADLFGNTVPIREPIDPNIKVIRLDQWEELDRHFREDTDWGKQIAARHRQLRNGARPQSFPPVTERTDASHWWHRMLGQFRRRAQ